MRFLDLEDSVAPNAKPDARAPLIKAAREEDWSDKVLSFRMNGIDTKWWYDDLITVVGEAGEFIDDIIVPKVKSASDVHTVENLLAQVEENNGLEVGASASNPRSKTARGSTTFTTISPTPLIDSRRSSSDRATTPRRWARPDSTSASSRSTRATTGTTLRV